MHHSGKRRVRLLVNAIALTNIRTGIGRYVQDLYAELERGYGDEFEITYFDGRGLSRAMPAGPDDNARWSLATSLFWKLPPRVGSAIRVGMHRKREAAFHRLAGEFDLYHEPGFFPFRVPNRVKVAFTIHDMSVQRHPEYHPRERVLFYDRLFSDRSKLADRILTVSEFSKSEIQALTDFRPDRIDVTPLGYDPATFFPAADGDVRDTMDRLGLPKDFVLFVGTNDPRKNMQAIPEALKRVGLDVPLVTVGWSGWDRNHAHGNVISLGYVSDSDLRNILSAALALVFPSSYEGFGLPVLEAMACGCPVITNRAASMPEVGGDAAAYVERDGDIGELGEVLRRVVDSPKLRTDMREKGLERAGLFSWERTARDTAAAFEKALSR